jgi:hypothetical protein
MDEVDGNGIQEGHGRGAADTEKAAIAGAP